MDSIMVDTMGNIKIEVKYEDDQAPEMLRRSCRNRKPKKYEKIQRLMRMYTCVHCPQTFSRLSQLRSHSKLHLDEVSLLLFIKNSFVSLRIFYLGLLTRILLK